MQYLSERVVSVAAGGLFLFFFFKNAFCAVKHNDLYDLYSFPYIIRVNKPRVIRWTGHAERMGGERRGIQGLGGAT